MLLTKSDFKAARTCETKLYYRQKRYPAVSDDDPFLEFLAHGGYMVEAIARLLFPGGGEIVADSMQASLDATRTALQQEEVVLFQPTVCYEQLVATLDILEKRGNDFRIVEVKSSSIEPKEGQPNPFRGTRGKILAEWREDLEDITYQTLILRSLYPNSNLTPCLCVVDKTQLSTSETAFENFYVESRGKDQSGTFRQPLITFSGDIEALRAQPFVRMFEVSAEVEELLPVVRTEAAKFVATLAGTEPVQTAPALGAKCKKCEYRSAELEPAGFKHCWGDLANPSPHLLDLYRVDRLDNEVITDMISQRRTGLCDVEPTNFKGSYGERQLIQLEYTTQNREFVDPELLRRLATCKYPLHFIDFEATRMAVPYYAGMHPYGLVAFQWSCHTIAQPGTDVIHSEWINVEDSYPNFEFACALKQVVSGEGTVFVWSPFEKTVFTDIKDHLRWYVGEDDSLSDWLDKIIDDNGPIVDLCRLTLQYYFHPDMGGSTSIKKVLPAVWLHDEAIRNHKWFSGYLREQDGQILEPYKTLRPMLFNDEPSDAVSEGTAAIRTYHDMMYGKGRSDLALREDMKGLLLEYCKLDTAAMVMIWMHWTGSLQKN